MHLSILMKSCPHISIHAVASYGSSTVRNPKPTIIPRTTAANVQINNKLLLIHFFQQSLLHVQEQDFFPSVAISASVASDAQQGNFMLFLLGVL